MAVDAPITTTDRQAKFREKRKAEGYKFVQVWLPAETCSLLERHADYNQLSKTDTLNKMIEFYAEEFWPDIGN